MNRENPNISVIVPIYNVEQYLRRCIDSILSQTFTDFELLLVDDGSPDRCGEICDEYARKDDRVRVFHKENGGVSTARNYALTQIRGGRIAFVDADDYIDAYYIERLVEYDADMVLCGNKNVGSMTREFHLPELEVGFDGIGEVLEKQIDAFIVPWGKIFDAKIIQQNGLRFDETMFVGEDVVFVQSYLMHCKSLRFISYTGYCYWHDDHVHLYLMDEKQAVNFLAKVLTTFNTLCSVFGFSNKQFIAQNYMFAINRVLLNQSFKHSFSLMDLSKPKRFLETIPTDAIPVEYANRRAEKVILFLLRHHAYTFTTLLWRFAMPLYKKIKSIR